MFHLNNFYIQARIAHAFGFSNPIRGHLKFKWLPLTWIPGLIIVRFLLQKITLDVFDKTKIIRKCRRYCADSQRAPRSADSFEDRVSVKCCSSDFCNVWPIWDCQVLKQSGNFEIVRAIFLIKCFLSKNWNAFHFTFLDGNQRFCAFGESDVHRVIVIHVQFLHILGINAIK